MAIEFPIGAAILVQEIEAQASVSEDGDSVTLVFEDGTLTIKPNWPEEENAS